MAFRDEKRETELFEEIERKWGRRIQEAFNASLDELRERMTLEQIVAALEQTGVATAAAIITDDQIRGAMRAVGATWQEAFIDAGQQRIEAISGEVSGPRGRIETSFDIGNENAAQKMRDNRARLVREISDNQRDAIAQAVDRGLNEGLNPRDFAREVRESVGLTAKQEQSVQNFKKNLQEGNIREVFGRETRDKRFDRTLARVANGETELTDKQIERMTQRFRERAIKRRSETIARTESLRAMSEAKQASLQQLVDDGEIDEQQIRREWVTANDERVRSDHRQIPGLNPNGVGLNEPFQTPLGPLMIPRDPNGLPENTIQCRCATVEEIVDFEDL